MQFFTLFYNESTRNAGDMTTCYTKSFAKKFGKLCKKHPNFSSDFKEIFVEKVLKKSINVVGKIVNGDTKELERVGCNDLHKAYKIRKLWSSDLRDNMSIRMDYIFSLERKILFFIDLRLKSNNNERNHDEKMIRDIMTTIKSEDYELIAS